MALKRSIIQRVHERRRDVENQSKYWHFLHCVIPYFLYQFHLWWNGTTGRTLDEFMVVLFMWGWCYHARLTSRVYDLEQRVMELEDGR